MDFNYNQMPVQKRYSKAEIYQAIQQYCYQQTGVVVTNMVRIDDSVSNLRHSCLTTGVTYLPKYIWQVPSEMGVIEVPYYFCPQCGKLFVYNHIYD